LKEYGLVVSTKGFSYYPVFSLIVYYAGRGSYKGMPACMIELSDHIYRINHND